MYLGSVSNRSITLRKVRGGSQKAFRRFGDVIVNAVIPAAYVLHAAERFVSCYFNASLRERGSCLALERQVVSPTEPIVERKQTVV